MSEFTDSPEVLFDEISIIVPCYSIEDLPTDLEEDAAEGLLNAFLIGWHPNALLASHGIPTVRQADAVRHFTGRHLIIIPKATEDWMPHDWQNDTAQYLHAAIADCQTRESYLKQLTETLNEATPDSSSTSDAAAPALPDELSAPFLAFGLTWLMTVLTARRMHHFVDPDAHVIGSEIRLAAEAAIANQPETARTHLNRCYEQLLETRERFYPTPMWLVDICIPPRDTDADQLTETIQTSGPLNIVAAANEIAAWLKSSEKLRTTLASKTPEQIQLLTGHASEIRPSLGPLTATLADIDQGRLILNALTKLPVEHWARKRFGLISSLPMLLAHTGFRTAAHVALDDGLYPDKERSQFEWQAPSGDNITATSRIPLAIDSAASILRMPDRLQECMQDDHMAVLYLARLPMLNTPWLGDLRLAATFAPVLGEFTTPSKLAEFTEGQRDRLKFDHAEYLSPTLIQSAVLKTEPPISGPATISKLWAAIETSRTLDALCTMLGLQNPGQVGSSESQSPNLSPNARSAKLLPPLPGQALQIQAAAAQLLDIENDHAEIHRKDGLSSSDARVMQTSAESRLKKRVEQMIRESAAKLAEKTGSPSKDVGRARSILLINSLPFARTRMVPWPRDWNLPKTQRNLVAISNHSPVDSALWAEEQDATDPSRACVVELPPGGFVWLSEATDSQSSATIFQGEKREAPLAESLTLRNRHFEVTLSERHGGIESVIFHGTRSNRLSQHVTWRYEREQRIETPDGFQSTWYAHARRTDQRIVTCDPVQAALETTIDILSPIDGSPLLTCKQTVAIDRFRPQLTITVSIEQIDRPLKGNPWMEYLASRFAWENESASITRGVWGQAAGFKNERFESPDYIEVADQDHRLTIIPHGRPYHRRSGPRMIDSLILCEGETQRSFQFTVVFDQPFPMRQCLDATVPPARVQPSPGFAGKAEAAWLWGLSAKNVMAVRVGTSSPCSHNSNGDLDEDVCASDSQPSSAETSAPLSVRLLLIETEGMICECTIRTAVLPRTAALIRHDGSITESLPISDQGVLVRFAPFELREVELQF
ncbi:MAG: hypothetical protein R3C20_19850 [Planctomycetaceae bacterium]